MNSEREQLGKLGNLANAQTGEHLGNLGSQRESNLETWELGHCKDSVAFYTQQHNNSTMKMSAADSLTTTRQYTMTLTDSPTTHKVTLQLAI